MTPAQEPAISRVYGFLSYDNHLYRAAGAAIEIMGDAYPGDPGSPIVLIKRFQLPPEAMCTPDDLVVGVSVLADGRVAFATNQGMLGVVPREPELMTAPNAIVRSVNGASCADPNLDPDELETTTNNLVADERGRFYALTTKAMYKLRVDADSIEQVWRTPYETGSAGGGVRIDSGSGSTPTLMGTAPGDDRFVVITDGQQLMHLVLAWRDRIPSDWEGLPDRPRRIACEYPVDFGDPTREASSSEQSVVVRGYGSYLPNNELRNAGELNLPINNQQARQAIAGLAGAQPRYQPFGFERIDWDPENRECFTKWVNPDVSIPNGVPYLSAGSRMVYGIGAREGVNGLEGMDMDTGESKLWVPAGSEPERNAFFSALNIDEDGSMWTGGFNGMTKYELGAPPFDGPTCTVPRRPGTLARGPGGPRYIPTITGSDGDDRLRGTDGDDVIAALGGDDRITALAGDDVICGGAGDDAIEAGAGGDVVKGNSGADFVGGAGGADDLHGDRDDDTLDGGAGKDRCAGGGERDRPRRCERYRPDR